MTGDNAIQTTETTAPAVLWLTVEQAAKRLQVSKGVIYRVCSRRELRHAVVGGRRQIRLKAEWVDAWLERCADVVEPVER